MNKRIRKKRLKKEQELFKRIKEEVDNCLKQYWTKEKIIFMWGISDDKSYLELANRNPTDIFVLHGMDIDKKDQ